MNQVHLFVKRLVSDEQFRRLAIADPSAAFRDYKLSAVERQSLTNLCLKLSADGTVAAKIGPTGFWV